MSAMGPLSGPKRTCRGHRQKSVRDPKATSSRVLNAASSWLVYFIRREERSDRDAYDVTNSLLRRRLTEIEEHWLK